MSSPDLHIFFLPLLAPGHMIPMVDMAKLFAARNNVKATIVTTPGNVSRIQPTLDGYPHHVQLLTIPFLSSLPENLADFPTPNLAPDFLSALDSLESPFEELVIAHRPDCIVSDLMYPWTAHLAAEHNIPRLYFTGTSSFTLVARGAIRTLGPLPDDRPFLLPGMPHRIEMLSSQLPHGSTAPDGHHIRLFEAHKKTLGAVMNTFHELESGYIETFHGKVWLVGPVSLCNNNDSMDNVRGGGGEGGHSCFDWLDSKKSGSVLYVCFGSISQFTSAQFREIATGLILSRCPFIWVVRNMDDETWEWMNEEVGERGLLVRGWAPQMAILNHRGVGGFLTHCGWNSCLEGATAGLPMVTWPLFAEQFFNERLVVDVMRVGVAVGSKVCTYSKEERTLVSGEEVKKAIEEVMGSGEEAQERRKRAEEIAGMARKALEEGGSSYNDLSNLIQELVEIKRNRVVVAN